MANMLRDVRALLADLIDAEVSRNKTFYVAEITGEHRKYGLNREFTTDKRSPYTLDRGDFEVGGVYEIKDDREGLRCWFKITDVAPDDPYPFEIITLDRGDDRDEEFILEHVDGSPDDDGGDVDSVGGLVGKEAELADRLRAADSETLDRVEAVLDAADADGDTAADFERVSLMNVPEQVRKDAKTHRSAFKAAYQKHTGADAGPMLQAVASDAAILAIRTDD